MRRFLFLACGLISAVAASAAVSTEVAPPSKLSAAQIVARNVAARGGLDAWRAVNTLTLSGQMEAGGTKNTELPFVMKMKRPHKTRFELRFQDLTAVQVYDGARGWKLRPFLGRDGADPFTPAEIKAAASWAELDGPLIDYANKGTKLELQGMESVEGHDAYKIKLRLKDGEERNVWIDAASFLELKIDGEPRKLDGKMHKVAVYYRDYKPENGLTMPHVLETAVEGVKQTHKMTIQQVAVSRPIDDALFGKPPATAAKASAK
jgi:hypothetical protein